MDYLFLVFLAALYLSVGFLFYTDVAKDLSKSALMGNPLVATLIIILWFPIVLLMVPALVALICFCWVAEGIETFLERRRQSRGDNDSDH